MKKSTHNLDRFLVLGAIIAIASGGLVSCGDGGDMVDVSGLPTTTDFRTVEKLIEAPVVISGRVTIKGEIPTPDAEWDVSNDGYCSNYQPIKTKRWKVGENDALGDVVVGLVGGKGGSVDTRPALMDQAGCCYIPHVVAIAAGEAVQFTNSDQTFHNVRVDRHKQGTLDGGSSIKNYGQPAGGANLHQFPAEGVYRIQCDLHRWMRSWVFVHDSGFYGVTGEDGIFEIRGEISDGEYELFAWHSQFAEPIKKQLTISEGSAKIDFEFPASSAMIPGAPGK